MLIKWLVFSDIHFQFENVDTEIVRNKLLRFILDEKLQTDFILMCGDCFYMGDANKRQECEDFIHKIVSNGGCDKSQLYMTPGNHDLTRKNFRSHEISYYTGINYENGKKKEDAQVKEIDETVLDTLFGKEFNNFKELHKNVTGKAYSGRHVCVEHNGYRILDIGY